MFVKLVTLQDAPFGNVDAYIHPDDIRRIITVDDNLRAHMGAPGDTMSIVVVRQYNNSEENVYTSLSPQIGRAHV